jgi:hypothetical protein
MKPNLKFELNLAENQILMCFGTETDEPKVKPTDLRGILQYIPQFREKTFILAIDGAIVTDENFATLLLDVAVLRSLNSYIAGGFTGG